MSPNIDKSKAAFKRADISLVGGVNSPARAFKAVDGDPLFISKASGATVIDIDENEYVDYVASYGPAILGHAHERIITAINKAARNGTSFGAPTEMESQLAEKIISLVDSVEKVRFINSGTEAVMTAIRLARGYTKRDKLVKFIGCYHGHCDAMLIDAGSGATTLGIPSSPGVPAAAVADTISVQYNDIEGIEEVMKSQGSAIAAILVEPVAGNMGVVPPADGFLQKLRQLCDKYGALLIFDEVMTGFRVSPGGAQELYDIRPDLTTMGKIIGGGMPVGAVGGPAEIMNHLAPVGDIYQAGTLSGNPAAMAAGIATLEVITSEEDFYEKLEETSSILESALIEEAGRAGIGDRVCLNRVGSMLSCFFTPGPVIDYPSATSSNTEAFREFFKTMLDNGVYIAPSQYEALFVSSEHSVQTIHTTRLAAEAAFAAAAKILE